MKNVVGIRFRPTGKAYFFDPGDYEITAGTAVIVETAQGMEYGKAVAAPMEVEDERVKEPLKKIMRVATPKDDEQHGVNLEKEKDALRLCKEKIVAHELEMKLIEAEYTFDRSKLTFYFTADGRVDFRELVKDLAGTFRTRIELRQIGVRDATKMLGGIGTCGRELCCHAYMRDFVPVSIKMAKEQNLSLNPGKISGMCGRLMCCLSYEAETYAYLNRQMPKVNDKVTLPDGGEGTVQAVDILRGKVKVITFADDEKQIEEYEAADLKFRRRGGKDKNNSDNLTDVDDIELSGELAALTDDSDTVGRQENRNKNKQENKGGKKRNNGNNNNNNNINSDRDNSGNPNGNNNGNNGNINNGNNGNNGNAKRNRNRNRGNRNDNRNENRGDNKNDNRNVNKNDNRGDNRNHHRGENGKPSWKNEKPENKNDGIPKD
ncbi:Cell fate regulator YaaT, PSP1 superfamily (controls sporulation, competence, biofilm development) [Lachnospiraceae bacterium XPB1003]|nr:Cell fate regulator YaaT, PSP1 superfamily (controls sporulation, competence, biofilm development) [Lachnospiraceae bacterium XPB1003]